MMLQQNYSFEVTESMPSHTVVGRVEATDADSLPENRIINYQLRALTVPLPVGDGAASSAAVSVTTSTATAATTTTTAALHFFTIDRLVWLILPDLLPNCMHTAFVFYSLLGGSTSVVELLCGKKCVPSVGLPLHSLLCCLLII